MADKCYHHPTNDATALCRYCARHLCEECLVYNGKSKYYICKDNEECLNYQNSQPVLPAMEFSNDKNSRPKCIVVICLMLFIVETISLLSIPPSIFAAIFSFEIFEVFHNIFKTDGLSSLIRIIYSMMGLFIVPITAGAMFLGYNWARWIYLTYAGINMVLSWVYVPDASPVAKLIGFVLYAVIFYYLSKPVTSAFFHAREALEV